MGAPKIKWILKHLRSKEAIFNENRICILKKTISNAVYFKNCLLRLYSSRPSHHLLSPYNKNLLFSQPAASFIPILSVIPLPTSWSEFCTQNQNRWLILCFLAGLQIKTYLDVRNRSAVALILLFSQVLGIGFKFALVCYFFHIFFGLAEFPLYFFEKVCNVSTENDYEKENEYFTHIAFFMPTRTSRLRTSAFYQ